MLKKLLKYDWKFMWKVPTVILGFLLLITLLGIASMLTPIWNFDSPLTGALMAMLIMFYYIALFAGSIAVSVYIAVRYYKNIYTDEGYLTNTLPVTAWQIILSKTIVGTVWIIITGIVVVFSVLSIIIVAGFSYGELNMFTEFSRIFNEYGAEMERTLGISLGAFTAVIILVAVVGSVFSVMMMYSSIALGQLFTKHKLAGAVIWYIGEYTIVQLSSSLALNIPMFAHLMIDDNYYNAMTVWDIIGPFFIGYTILTLILSVAMFFITEYILKKKLNLD